MEREYEITSILRALYNGTCKVNSRHLITRREKIGRLKDVNNPFLPVQGFACTVCVEELPWSKDSNGN